MSAPGGHRTGWRCQLRVRIPEALAKSGEVLAFRSELERAAAARELTIISVQAVAVDRSVSLVVESASDVEELMDAVSATEQLVRGVADTVWPRTDGEQALRTESVAARRL
ncbi:MAG: hypothetical protein ACJ74O_09060 [Frankiaceae bacterium]